MVLLLPVSLLLQTAIFALRRSPRPGLAREAFLKAAVVEGLIITAVAELLSLGRLLSFGPLAAVWILVVLAQAVAAGFLNGGWDLGGPRSWVLEKKASLGTWEAFEAAAVAAAVAALAVCGFVAWSCPPNNFDSMTYHMPRVLHWIQNQSVAHYPTNNLRQIAFPPGAAFIVVELQLLSGGDRCANLVQWLAFAGCLAAASLIARRLGAGRPGRVLAVLLAAGLPMAVLQSQTTQTDLLTAFWLMCFCVFAFKEGPYESGDTFWLSASLGLAILAKPTGLVFGAPLLLIVLSRRLRREPEAALTEEAAARHAGAAGLILLLALLVSAGHLARNRRGLGSFVAEDGRTLKTVVGLRQTAACALKNAALEVPVPLVWRGVLAVERHVLRLDPEDPRNNFTPQVTRYLGPLCRGLLLPDEDMAGAPLHLALLLWAVGVFAWAVKREEESPWRDRACLFSALAAGYLIFCALFKWQEWANRLLLPLYMLAAPWTAQVLEARLCGRPRQVLLGVLAATALVYSATAIHRPLIALPAALTTQWQSPSILKMDREAVYETGYAKTHAQPLRDIVSAIVKDDCGFIGLDVGKNEWEYAWWALLAMKSRVPAAFKHIHVANASANLTPEFPSEKLCGVVESQGGVIVYFDKNDMEKLHASGIAEPQRITEMSSAPR